MYDIVIDFETYWDKEYTLSKLGPVTYIRDQRFEIQLLGIRINGGSVRTFADPLEIESVLFGMQLDKPDRRIIAHNGSGFDFLVLSEYYGIKPKNMVDTIHMARWCGLSRLSLESHKAITAALNNGIKTEGTSISNGKHWPDDFTLEEQEAFKTYCMEDVLQCSNNFYAMLPFVTDDMLAFSSITSSMATNAQFIIDSDIVDNIMQNAEEETKNARTRLSHLFSFTNEEEFLKAIRSAKKCAAMFKQLGVDVPLKLSTKQSERKGCDVFIPALSKNDVEFVELSQHHNPDVALLVDTRLGQNSSFIYNRAKALSKLANGALPVMLSAFAAHTGRYGGGSTEGSDRINLQNMPKRNPIMKRLRKAIKAPQNMRVVAADSSQIEARILAFVAGQEDLVEIFRIGGDPYSRMAAFIFGGDGEEIARRNKAGDKEAKLARTVGKTAVLSAGYGVGASKFGNVLWMNNAKLHEDKEEHMARAEDALAIYRSTNQQITYFWRVCQEVIIRLANEEGGSFGGKDYQYFSFGMMPVAGYKKPVQTIELPSGYKLRYFNLRSVEEDGRIQYVYDRKLGRGFVPARIYGGLLTENIIQSLSFQVLMWQACRMYEQGIQLYCNVHDSFATIVPFSDAEQTLMAMVQAMHITPPWLEGCPLAAEGSIGNDFTIV